MSEPPIVHTIDRDPGLVESSEDPPLDTRPALDRVQQIVAKVFDGDARRTYGKELEHAGLDAALIAAGLADVSQRLGQDGRTLGVEERALAELLIDAARYAGTIEAAPALLQLERHGYSGASRTLDRVLARHAGAVATGCAPPSPEEVASTRTQLTDFAVIERRGEDLTARAPTESELEDLAYFYAAIADAGAPVGSSDDVVARLGMPAPTALHRGARNGAAAAARKDHLYALSDALETGDLQSGQAHAVAYLESLGYPDRIDGSLEADRTWGGPRFAYVMRDLARISEVVGEVEIAADLYRRATPGGGACGSSVDYRRGKQLRGLIRSEERAGRCQRVVAERLLDWDHDFADDERPAAERYGPARLAEAGWDVQRLYRGALLTRNRGEQRDGIEAALRALPSSMAAAALRRLDTMGPEHWEYRVRAAEGLADVAKADAIDPLASTLAVASNDLRGRILEALGDLTVRHWAGPCPEGFGTIGMGSFSNVWSRQVSALGHSCETQLDDDAADALARRLVPYLGSGNPAVTRAALETTGSLAAPNSRSVLRSWVKRSRRQAKAACDGVESWSERCQDATDLETTALESWDAWARVVDRASDTE